MQLSPPFFRAIVRLKLLDVVIHTEKKPVTAAAQERPSQACLSLYISCNSTSDDSQLLDYFLVVGWTESAPRPGGGAHTPLGEMLQPRAKRRRSSA